MSIFDEPKIDCHCHVFNPVRFAYEENAIYQPIGQELGTPAQFRQVLDAYNVAHALLVGPTSGYGADNRCLLDTLARSDGRLMGIANVGADASLEDLRTLKAAGVVGIAFNAAMLGVEVVLGAADLLGRLAELDLFAQIQAQDQQLVALMPALTQSRVRVLIDHCGRPEPVAGLRQPGFQCLLELARDGRAFVKLSGLAKFSHEPYPHRDTWPYVAQLLVTFSPENCVWGSDWPFLRASERMDYGTVLRLIERLMPHAEERRRVMWDTPRRLFGFSSPATQPPAR